MRIRDYKNNFLAWFYTSLPEDYGLSDDAGKEEMYDEWVYANYGNSSTAQYLREQAIKQEILR